MALAFIPKKDDWKGLTDILIQMNQRLDNLDGVRGNKLSHNNLKDTEDHDDYMKTEEAKTDIGSLISQKVTKADADATYGGAERDLINQNKEVLNKVIASVNDFKIRMRKLNIKSD